MIYKQSYSNFIFRELSRWRYALMVFLSLCSLHTDAHEQSVAAIRSLEQGGYQWQLNIVDLNKSIELDHNQDNAISLRELNASQPAITQLLNRVVSFSVGTIKCRNQLSAIESQRVINGYVARVNFTTSCPQQVAPDTLSYYFLNETDPLHVATYAIDATTGTLHGVLSATNNSVSLLDTADLEATTLTTIGKGLNSDVPRDSATPHAQAFDIINKYFVMQGIYHILIGIDHLLFLLVLIVPLLMNLYHQPSSHLSISQLCGAIARYTLLFTLAHSTTLVITALGWIALPGYLVESAIAATVALGGWNILRRNPMPISLVMVFVIGLIHGLGFASVFGNVASGNPLLSTIVSFNIGLEIGQLLFVAIVGGALFWLRQYQQAYLYYRLMGVAILPVALFWIGERLLAGVV